MAAITIEQARAAATSLKMVSDAVEPRLGKDTPEYLYPGNSYSVIDLRCWSVYGAVPVDSIKIFAAAHGWIFVESREYSDVWKWKVPDDSGDDITTPLMTIDGSDGYGKSIRHFIRLTADLEQSSEWSLLVEALYTQIKE